MNTLIIGLIAMALALFGGFVVAVIWWLCDAATKEADRPDFDNEAHWNKWQDVQSKRGNL